MNPIEQGFSLNLLHACSFFSFYAVPDCLRLQITSYVKDLKKQKRYSGWFSFETLIILEVAIFVSLVGEITLTFNCLLNFIPISISKIRLQLTSATFSFIYFEYIVPLKYACNEYSSLLKVMGSVAL